MGRVARTTDFDCMDLDGLDAHLDYLQIKLELVAAEFLDLHPTVMEAWDLWRESTFVTDETFWSCVTMQRPVPTFVIETLIEWGFMDDKQDAP